MFKKIDLFLRILFFAATMALGAVIFVDISLSILGYIDLLEVLGLSVFLTVVMYSILQALYFLTGKNGPSYGHLGLLFLIITGLGAIFVSHDDMIGLDLKQSCQRLILAFLATYFVAKEIFPHIKKGVMYLISMRNLRKSPVT